MPKYYCDYCKSYLTHDSTSVRKSHLVGKNHLRYVYDYYEREAIKLEIWDKLEKVAIFTIDDAYGKGAPGAKKPSDPEEKANDPEFSSTVIQNPFNHTLDLPPPLPLPSMPHPPPSVFRTITGTIQAEKQIAAPKIVYNTTSYEEKKKPVAHTGPRFTNSNYSRGISNGNSFNNNKVQKPDNSRQPASGNRNYGAPRQGYSHGQQQGYGQKYGSHHHNDGSSYQRGGGKQYNQGRQKYGRGGYNGGGYRR